MDTFYHINHEVSYIVVSQINSIQTQIPFDYRYLDLCEPAQPNYLHQGIIETLTNTHKSYTNYNISINLNTTCSIACMKDIKVTDYGVFQWLIERNYLIDFSLDSLPAGWNVTNPLTQKAKINYEKGIPIGYKLDDIYYVYNHYNIYVDIHEKNNQFQVVGFNIEPISIKFETKEMCEMANYTDFYFWDRQELIVGKVLFTYNTIFRHSNVTFASRWDYYFSNDRDIHWWGWINANIWILIFSFLMFFILTRAIKKEIEIYNSKVIDSDDVIIDEYGWKQVCHDVFRAPKYLMLLCGLIGNGVELTLMVIISWLVYAFGVWSPEWRGSLINIMIFVYCFLGLIAGYVSCRLYKINGGKAWWKCSIETAILFPSFAYTILIISKTLFSFEHSSLGFSFSECWVLLLWWCWISCPLVFIGSFLAIKGKNTFKFPCKVNVVPSTIGDKPWYLKIKYITWLTGWIPFATIFVEFIYIMAAMWKHQAFFLASFVFLSVICLIILSSEISFIFTFLNWCKGDYNWWWKSFIVSASPALYIMGYSLYYFFYINITRFTATVVYFLLMGWWSLMIGLICGACGVFFTFGFLVLIYSKIKID